MKTSCGGSEIHGRDLEHERRAVGVEVGVRKKEFGAGARVWKFGGREPNRSCELSEVKAEVCRFDDRAAGLEAGVWVAGVL